MCRHDMKSQLIEVPYHLGQKDVGMGLGPGRLLTEETLDALSQRSGGRPTTPTDQEKEQLSREVEQLRKEIALLEQGRKIREILDSNTGSEDKKKE